MFDYRNGTFKYKDSNYMEDITRNLNKNELERLIEFSKLKLNKLLDGECATKYLNNYLTWFKFLYISEKNKEYSRINDLFVSYTVKDICITKDMIKDRYIQSK